jgi:hypothetical protein
MRSSLGILALCLAGAGAHAGEPAGKLFVKRCAVCHAIPDAAIRTDLAWLDQVNRTS